MTPEAVLARFREYMVGPTRFMTLLSCFELGVIDALRERPGMTAADLGARVGVRPDAVEQLLFLLVKETFVAYDEGSRTYTLDALAHVAERDLRRALTYLNMIKVVALRQLFHLTESARTGTLVGLKELYGAEGTLYGAVADHPDLRDSWATLMDAVTANIDPWFFANIDLPPGANVLDLAGNTGLGAIDAHRLKPVPGLRVTTFDLPEKQDECLRNFKDHGLEQQCSFIGGDVFDGVPTGFDTVLIKHFLDMFDKRNVVRILAEVGRSLEPGGQVCVLVPVYPENVQDADNYNVDFFPAFFLGCTMGEGGPQKLSTYVSWLEECGFTVTRAVTRDAADLPPDVIPVPAVLCATKSA
ncbi:methyltransferase domain-containing protein [Actinocorallia sp. API 0066]|uniref:methyltransferase n=1 Tax=Actinocorallia sp. API 0066 TaxID=2896846 RepID=UPI001E480F79|nr:methyltransferase [Actinocorallia sp. API 0066]MCD0448190.1 methyltransferase domain-containing protein [Actinocorallia sp. API 0066]